jgi:ATP-dependent Clp protease ATP-binding subunit ClpC
MFERYTEKARRVVFFGRYEASQFGSAYIETEHLLLALLREDKALMVRVLPSIDADQEIRKEIEANTATRGPVRTRVDLPLSNESKRVLAYTAEEAVRLNHKHIGTEHLLLGLLREEKCFAAELLHSRNVSLEKTREAVRESEGQGPASTPPQQSSSASYASIDEFGIDLTQQAIDGLLPPLIGRDRELERAIQVLCRHTQANPLLLGEPGVGKKTIVYGLAKRTSGGLIRGLDGWRVLSLDLAVIGASVKSRTRFEESLEGILGQRYYGRADLILFIDSLVSLVQAPQFLSLANMIKPGLVDGRIHCISRATPAEYSKGIEIAPWLAQQFSVIEVKPATESEAVAVLTGVKERFEKFHGVVYTDEAIRYAVFHSSSYFPDRYLPEKAIDLMDEAGARVKIRQPVSPGEIRDLEKRIRLIEASHNRALESDEFEKARSYRDEIKKELENLDELRKKLDIPQPSPAAVTREDIDQVVAERTGASIELLRKSASGDL